MLNLVPSGICLCELTLDEQDSVSVDNEVVWLCVTESTGIFELKPLSTE